MPAAATPTVRAALRHAVARTDALRAGRRLLVAFSGGQDSTCLVHALAHLAGTLGFGVVAAHVDHSLRATSSADAERAAEAASAVGVPVIVQRVDVAGYRLALGRASVQQAARSARYQALAAAQAELGADAIVVAHTADDQAETILLNLIRGAGLEGLAGMRLDEWADVADYGPSVAEARSWLPLPSHVRLVRPLLSVERNTTRDYCAEQGLSVVEDPSNQTRAYTRNRVRLDLLPALEQFNPSVRLALARMADVVGDDAVELDRLARKVHDVVSAPLSDGFRYGDLEWRGQGRAIQRRLLRLAIARLTGTVRDVASGPIEDALDFVLVGGPPDRSYDLPGGVHLRTVPGGFEVRLLPSHSRALEFSGDAGNPSV